MNIGDQIQLGLLALTAVGLFLNLFQNRSATRQKSAEYLVDLVHQYATDEDILEARYAIEYGDFKYDDSFHDSPLEKKFDKLLDYYDTVARLCLSSQLSLKDLEFMVYDFLIIYQDVDIQCYLKFLDGWYSDRGIGTKPFASFRKVGKSMEDKYYVGSNQAMLKVPKRFGRPQISPK